MSTNTKITTSTLAGFMKDRTWIGHADERQTFDGAVPRQAAIDLLSYPLVEGSVWATIVTDDGVTDIDMPDRKAIVRADTQAVFGVFKQGYAIHQPKEWCIDKVDAVLDGGLEIETVAVVKGGARVLLQASVPEDMIATAPGAVPVAHRPRLTVATSHDGSIATSYSLGTRLLVCENELSLPGFRRLLKEADLILKYRHTRNSEARASEVRASLGLILEQVTDEFDREFRELVGQYVSDAKFEEIVKAYTGVDKAKEGRSRTIAQGKVDALTNLWCNDERAASWRNSAYGVLAAFNTAQQYIFSADKGRTERNQDQLITGKREQFDGNVLKMLERV